MKKDKHIQLKQFLDAQLKASFSWGTNDCALFAADWVLERTGVDYASEFRGTYNTESGSIEALNRLSYDSLSSALHDRLGEPLSSKYQAQRGDIALIETSQGLACGVVTAHGVVCRGYRKLAVLPMGNIVFAWRIA